MTTMSSNSMTSFRSNTNTTSTSSSSSEVSSGLSMRQEVLAGNKARKARNSYASTNSTVITKIARPVTQIIFITTEQSDASLRDKVNDNISKHANSTRSGSRANTFNRNKHAR